MAVDISGIASVLGALGAGTVLGQMIAAGKDRRAARASVLDALSELERRRWIYEDGFNFDEFIAAERKLATAALIAKVPREPIRTYLILARAALWESQQSYKNDPKPDASGAIESRFADMVREAAQLLANVTWAATPLSRLGYRYRAAKILKKAQKTANLSTRKYIEQAIDIVV